MTTSGTSSPRCMKSPTWRPSGVPSATSARSRSPAAMCSSPRRCASRSPWVPLPEPGGPMSSTFTAPPAGPRQDGTLRRPDALGWPTRQPSRPTAGPQRRCGEQRQLARLRDQPAGAVPDLEVLVVQPVDDVPGASPGRPATPAPARPRTCTVSSIVVDPRSPRSMTGGVAMSTIAASASVSASRTPPASSGAKRIQNWSLSRPAGAPRRQPGSSTYRNSTRSARENPGTVLASGQRQAFLRRRQSRRRVPDLGAAAPRPGRRSSRRPARAPCRPGRAGPRPPQTAGGRCGSCSTCDLRRAEAHPGQVRRRDGDGVRVGGLGLQRAQADRQGVAAVGEAAAGSQQPPRSLTPACTGRERWPRRRCRRRTGAPAHRCPRRHQLRPPLTWSWAAPDPSPPRRSCICAARATATHDRPPGWHPWR